MNWERMHALIVKEFIQLMRDRITLAIVVFMPLAQLLIFGFAINTDIKHLRTVVFDQSRTQESREMINSLTSSNYFDVIKYAGSVKEVDQTVESGRAKVGIVFPPDYASRIKGGRQTSVQVIIDATDNLSASSALAAAQTIGMLKSQEILAEKFSRLGMKIPGQAVDMRIRLWYNPDFITSWYIVPGIMGLHAALSFLTPDRIIALEQEERRLTEQLVAGVLQNKRVRLAGVPGTEGRVGVISMDCLSMDNAEVAYRLEEEYGVCTRCGLHCAPSAHRTLGTFPQGTVRFSIGYGTTDEEVDTAVSALLQIVSAG